MGTLRRYWFWVLVGLGVAWWFFTGDTPVDVLTGLVGRGRRLSVRTIDDSGTVVESLGDLVAQAVAVLGTDVQPDAYLLASVSASEHPNAGEREKAAIQRVVINDAAAHGWSKEYAVTVGKGMGHQSGRRYSSARDPYEDDLRIAVANLNGTQADETSGATNFVHKTGFKTLSDYSALCAKWYASSKIVPVALDGIPSFRLFLPEDSVTGGQGNSDGDGYANDGKANTDG